VEPTERPTAAQLLDHPFSKMVCPIEEMVQLLEAVAGIKELETSEDD